MSQEFVLDESAYAVWKALEISGRLDVAQLVETTGVDQSQVTAAATKAAEQGFFVLEERSRDELLVTESAASVLEQGLPERRAAVFISSVGGEAPIDRFIGWTKENRIAPHEVFKWGAARGWIERVKNESGVKLVLTSVGRDSLDEPDDDERAIQVALETGHLFLDSLVTLGIDVDRVQHLLAKRSELARIKRRIFRTFSLNESGRDVLNQGVRVLRERNILTSEDLESGAWREIQLRPYDVALSAREVFPAKIHPLRKIMEETRRAFLEMGFEEVVSPMVESAFWNFDALFQPQDHPARDMQDTFYMMHPKKICLPPQGVVDPVKRTHEDGWETGSEGWGYEWSAERARQAVLRTHTTAATIRALARNPDPPGKYFCVGWTYRNETISFKHLPVFHQVDGIVVDKDANLATLLGTLQEFYRKMGFEKVRFKPAFYPYTEPSVDVVVYMESRGKWLEMGGSGVFRPEVTQPLGCKYPVLAWGLGIERLAMLRCGFDDIRDLYRSNLDSLEGVPLCR